MTNTEREDRFVRWMVVSLLVGACIIIGTLCYAESWTKVHTACVEHHTVAECRGL